MKTVALKNLGRFGNRMSRYAHARAWSEQNGYELRTEPWEGEVIFTLDGAKHARPDGTEDFVIDGYCQNQQSIIYTRKDCRRWFSLQPWAIELLAYITPVFPVAHIRRGDYLGAGYPVLTEKAVRRAIEHYEIKGPLTIISDSEPAYDCAFKGELSMIPDFVRMMRAPVLFRGNSTFSFWAGVLSHGRVFSPRIDGLAGGIEHDNVPYEDGNHCRCADLAFVTDLHLPE